ncbi:YHS domain protein OS=Afipia felis OX=1035 GN=BN961_02594 PE=4 SV=1 [Afipia felis]
MTAWRQENKGRSRKGLNAAAALVVAALMGCAAARAASTERVVSNHYTGLAIDGYDPVGYFLQSRPVPGKAGIETYQGGAIWRFSGERERDIFLSAPDIYGPQFGGYDPLDLAAGRIVAGQPLIWLVFGQRLYLFSRIENRDAFAADPSKLAGAIEKWPALSGRLADY